MSNLKDRRKAMGLSQSDLAYLAEIKVRLIQDYEQGHRNINGAAGLTLYKIAQALHCNMEDLLELEQKEVDI